MPVIIPTRRAVNMHKRTRYAEYFSWIIARIATWIIESGLTARSQSQGLLLNVTYSWNRINALHAPQLEHVQLGWPTVVYPIQICIASLGLAQIRRMTEAVVTFSTCSVCIYYALNEITKMKLNWIWIQSWLVLIMRAMHLAKLNSLHPKLRF